MDQFKQTNSDTSNNPEKKYIINWVIIAVLMSYCVYLFTSKNNLARDNNIALQQQQQIIDSVKTDRRYLQADFDAASLKIDQLMSKNTGLKDSFQNNKTALVALQMQIRAVLSNKQATQTELMKARNMIYILNDKAQTYELYIAELERDNKTLTRENKLLSKERDATVEKNIALNINEAALHASNIRVKPIHKLSDGMEKATFNARKVDKLRIFFDISRNQFTESSNKQIYIRIIAPGNRTLYSDIVSGTINTIKEHEIKFSMLKEIYLIKNQPLTNVVAEWLQQDGFSKGPYEIELYNEGYIIGQSHIELK